MYLYNTSRCYICTKNCLSVQMPGTLAADLAFDAYQFTFDFRYCKLNLYNEMIKCQPTAQYKIIYSVKMNNLDSTSMSEPLSQCADYNSKMHINLSADRMSCHKRALLLFSGLRANTT